MKKYIYLAINGLSLSNLKIKFASSNFKEFTKWLESQEKDYSFVELEAWKVEEGNELNKNNTIYIGDAAEVLRIQRENKRMKHTK